MNLAKSSFKAEAFGYRSSHIESALVVERWRVEGFFGKRDLRAELYLADHRAELIADEPSQPLKSNSTTAQRRTSLADRGLAFNTARMPDRSALGLLSLAISDIGERCEAEGIWETTTTANMFLLIS
jgi:hypothetical protein